MVRYKIQIMSDLHLDSPKAQGFPALVPDVDLVIVGGDTCEGIQNAIKRMRGAYPNTEIVTIAGNHEFYGSTLPDETAAGREIAREARVHFLENDTLQLGSLRIIGATLWTDYALGGSIRHNMQVAREIMRDHRKIKWQSQPWRRFRPQEAQLLHQRSRSFIEGCLASTHGGPTIVVTHHAPIASAIAPEVRGTSLAAAYASELAPLIERYGPDAWIWGHTHYPIDARLGRTRLISNPCGYPDEDTRFNPSFTIDLDERPVSSRYLAKDTDHE